MQDNKPNHEKIGEAFVQHYYMTFDNDPLQLKCLYLPQSTLTFEGTVIQGPDAIVQKFQTLGKVQHDIPRLTKDIQIGMADGALLIMITGQLIVDGNAPLLFAQTFQLGSNGPGNFYIHNEVHRLVSA